MLLNGLSLKFDFWLHRSKVREEVADIRIEDLPQREEHWITADLVCVTVPT